MSRITNRSVGRLRAVLALALAGGCWSAGVQAGPAEGGMLYDDFCVVCHGPLGGGETMGKPLVDEQAQALSDEALIAVIRDGRTGTGMSAFGDSLSETELLDIAGYVRVLQGGTGLQEASLTTAAGDEDPMVNAGRAVFEGAGGCIDCHSYRGQGGTMGPALDDVTDRVDGERLATELVFPDRYIAEGYGMKELVTEEGEVIRGRYRNETDETIQILSEDGRLWTTYFKDDLRLVEDLEESPMPPVYSTLSSQQQQALTVFLKSL